MINILKKIWGIWYYFILILEFLLLYPFFFTFLQRKKWHLYANRFRRLWSFTLFIFTGLLFRVTYEKEFKEKFFKKKERGPYIFCPNHTSYADIPLVLISLPGLYRFMAKVELARIPMFGIFFRTIDITVDRSSVTASFKAFEEAGESLDENVSLVLYPEGATSDNAPALMPFKKGPFKLAIDKQVSVVPISILDNWRLFPNDGKQRGRPGITRAIIHNPIETKGLTQDDVETLREKVYHVIDETIKKANEANQ